MRASCGPSGRGGRGSIVDDDPERYRRFGAAAASPLARAAGGPRRSGAGGGSPAQGQGADPGPARQGDHHLSPAASIISPGRSTATPGPGSRSSPGSGAGRSSARLFCCLVCAAGRDPLKSGPLTAAQSGGARGRGDGAAAATVNGLRSTVVAGQVLGVAGLADIAGDEEDARCRDSGASTSAASSVPVISGIITSVTTSSMSGSRVEDVERLAAAGAGDGAGSPAPRARRRSSG